MRAFAFWHALLLSTLVTASSTVASGTVYFENTFGAGGALDVYVNGQLALENVAVGSFMQMPAMEPGSYQLVLTPNRMTLGQQDVLRTTFTLPDSNVYRLFLRPDGYNTQAKFTTAILKLKPGYADGEWLNSAGR
ncbi:DUF4397 domain-containing protein [Deinococcus sp. YIM 77859]|uniref:DUF4397 domain-containing protein n=1 Tax=Deinococcus sp. YIM 77859 TaxID=1540221 RepID=UPI00068962B6|nr:DUF4397 domain-containing protein [Deinococcus sp. YIM 77859]